MDPSVEGKENEVRQLKSEVDTQMRTCSQLHLDLINNDRETTNQIAQAEQQIKEEEQEVRLAYERLMKSMKAFAMMQKDNFKKLKQ